MNSENVTYSLRPDLYSGNNIAIKLNFKNPNLVSASSVLDALEIITKESVILESATNSTVLFSRDIKDSCFIPP